MLICVNIILQYVANLIAFETAGVCQTLQRFSFTVQAHPWKETLQSRFDEVSWVNQTLSFTFFSSGIKGLRRKSFRLVSAHVADS